MSEFLVNTFCAGLVLFALLVIASLVIGCGFSVWLMAFVTGVW